RLSIISREWQVDAGGPDKQSQLAADFMREMLLAPQLQFDDKASKMLHAIFYGYGLAEMIWARDGRNIVIDAIKVRKARRFRFGQDGKLLLQTRSKFGTGEPMPDRKFWTWVIGSDHDDDAYGLGLGHWCYWPAFFKRNDIRLWMIFLDKFGAPTPAGKFPPTASQADINKLLQAAKAIATSSAVVYPETMSIDLIQATRSGSGEYGTAYEKFDQAIAKVILSQTATTMGTPGKLGNNQEQMQVREEVSKSDSDLQCASFNNGPVKWLTEWNYPNAIPPRVYRTFEEPDDLEKAADTDTKIAALGFDPSEDYVRQRYGDHWVKKAAPAPFILSPPSNDAQTPAARAAAAFAEGEKQSDGIDAMVKTLLTDSNVMDAPVAELRLAFAAATSFDDLKARIDALKIKGLNMDALGKSLTSTGFQLLGGAILGDMIAGQARTIGDVIGK
ncbi:MAG TPA: DUF935 family protein, partial [Rhizomicrobium sp.]|nr:DUF935 family protein [Rhizomicrobium sp.]